MGLTKPPRAFLNDSFSYLEYTGTDKWSQPIFKEPVTVNNCRIDAETVFSYSSSGKTLLYNGLIICYAGITTPLLSFKEQSKVIYGNQEHTIVRVVRVDEPFNDGVYAYELEAV